MRHSIDTEVLSTVDSRPIKLQLFLSHKADNSYHVDTTMTQCRNLKCAYKDKNLKLVHLYQRLLTIQQTHPHHQATVVYEIQPSPD